MTVRFDVVNVFDTVYQISVRATIWTSPGLLPGRVEKVLMTASVPIRFPYDVVAGSDGVPHHSRCAVRRNGIAVFESRRAAWNIMVDIWRRTNTTA